MTFLDDVLSADITEQARRVRFGPVAHRVALALVALLAGVLFGVGWLAAKSVTLIWFVAVWSVLAARAGWRAGRRRA